MSPTMMGNSESLKIIKKISNKPVMHLGVLHPLFKLVYKLINKV